MYMTLLYRIVLSLHVLIRRSRISLQYPIFYSTQSYTLAQYPVEYCQRVSCTLIQIISRYIGFMMQTKIVF